MKAETWKPAATVWTTVPAVVMAGLLAFQGGYYPAVAGIGAIVFSVLAVVRAVRNRGCSGRCEDGDRAGLRHAPKSLTVATVLGIGMIAWCAARPFVDGIASYETLATMARPALALATIAYWLQLTTREKQSALRLIAYEGVVFSLVALLMFVGILPYAGSVVDGRLQFTFQYANTAGIYFAVIACLMWANARSHGEKTLALAPILCLLLTQSIGALAAVALVAAAWAIGHIATSRASNDVTGGAANKRVLLTVEALVGGVSIIAAIAVLAPDRMGSAMQTGFERIVQTMDGARALASAPLIGIGPQQWRVLHLVVQSAQYTANVIHNSYLGFALSYGLIGVTLAGAAALALVQATQPVNASERIPGIAPASALLLIHALVDFDLAFGAIIVLAALMLLANRQLRSTDHPHEAQGSPTRRAQAAASTALAVALLLASGAALVTDVRENQFLAEIQTWGPQTAEAHIAEDPLALRDQTLRTALYQACDSIGQPQPALELEHLEPLQLDTPGSLALARCLYASNQQEEAESRLLSVLEQRPYSIAAFTETARLLSAHPTGTATIERYNELRGRAQRAIQTWPASTLSNQLAPAPISR